VLYFSSYFFLYFLFAYAFGAGFFDGFFLKWVVKGGLVELFLMEKFSIFLSNYFPFSFSIFFTKKELRLFTLTLDFT